jgi:hypothetical protein
MEELQLSGNKRLQTAWVAMFTAFAGGAPLESIALEFQVPLDQLKSRARQDGWTKLRDRLTAAGKANGVIEGKLERIQKNREANLVAWEKLREEALVQIEALKAGTLRIQKAWNVKGVVVTHDAPPGPGDWVNISTHLRTVSEGTYRALGDFAAQEKPGQDGVSVNAPQGPAITIILPGIVAEPRNRRAGDHELSQGGPGAAANQLIDLSDTVVEPAVSCAPAEAEAEPAGDEEAVPVSPKPAAKRRSPSQLLREAKDTGNPPIEMPIPPK